MARRISIQLSVNGIDEGFFVRSEDGSGRFYSDKQFKDYLRMHADSGNVLEVRSGELHKYHRPRDAGRS